MRRKTRRPWLWSLLVAGLAAVALAWDRFHPVLSGADRAIAASRAVDLRLALPARPDHQRGMPGAPDTIVVFADFECPHCRRVSATLRDLAAGSSLRLLVEYRHRPLTRVHANALSAAIAAECAAGQGRFFAYHDALFQRVALDGAPWLTVAAAAGVPDTASFARCLREPGPAEDRVAEDTAAAARLGIDATPTLILRGRAFSGALSPATIRALVARPRPLTITGDHP